MKTKQTLVSGFLAVILMLAFGACSAQEQRITGGDSFRFTVINGNAYSVSAGMATEGTVTIPAYYRPNADSDYLPVKEIGNDAFMGRKNIVRITIPSTVTAIGNNAFRECTGLTSIAIPNGVTAIGNNAFQGCTSLTSIAIPNSVTSIGRLAFSRCTGLTSITIPNGVTSIGMLAFADCTNLTSITIPNSVTSIGFSAFARWTAAQTINIEGHANQVSADRAWGERWRDNVRPFGGYSDFEAKINYLGN